MRAMIGVLKREQSLEQGIHLLFIYSGIPLYSGLAGQGGYPLSYHVRSRTAVDLLLSPVEYLREKAFL